LKLLPMTRRIGPAVLPLRLPVWRKSRGTDEERYELDVVESGIAARATK
jgi:hypothetical protein